MFGITNGGAWVFIASLFVISYILGIAAQAEKDETKRKAKAYGNRTMA